MARSEHDFLLRAETLARTLYAGKYRSGADKREYIEHPLALVSILKRHGVTDKITLAAALLHDAIEESDHAPETAIIIEREVGVEVLNVVVEVTDLPGLMREERRSEQITRAATYSTRAAWVRSSDKLANLLEILEFPPKWAAPHIVGYAAFAMRVVSVCGYVSTSLTAECEAAFAAINRRYACN